MLGDLLGHFPTGVLRNDRLLGQHYFGKDIFFLCLSDSDEFVTAQTRPLLHIDLKPNLIAFYARGINADIREELLSPKIVDGLSEDLGTGMNEFVAGLQVGNRVNDGRI